MLRLVSYNSKEIQNDLQNIYDFPVCWSVCNHGNITDRTFYFN